MRCESVFEQRCIGGCLAQHNSKAQRVVLRNLLEVEAQAEGERRQSSDSSEAALASVEVSVTGKA